MKRVTWERVFDVLQVYTVFDSGPKQQEPKYEIKALKAMLQFLYLREYGFL